jgi:hypothetical protein
VVLCRISGVHALLDREQGQPANEFLDLFSSWASSALTASDINYELRGLAGGLEVNDACACAVMRS